MIFQVLQRTTLHSSYPSTHPTKQFACKYSFAFKPSLHVRFQTETLSTAKKQVLLEHLLPVQTDSYGNAPSAHSTNQSFWLYPCKQKQKQRHIKWGVELLLLLLLMILKPERPACKGKAAAAYGTCPRRYSPALNKAGAISGDQFNTLLPWSN